MFNKHKRLSTEMKNITIPSFNKQRIFLFILAIVWGIFTIFYLKDARLAFLSITITLHVLVYFLWLRGYLSFFFWFLIFTLFIVKIYYFKFTAVSIFFMLFGALLFFFS